MGKDNIIIMGGAGYIGSHSCKALHNAGYTPVVIDNLSNGHERAVQWGPLEVADINDTAAVINLFKQYKPLAIIHFAGLIEVSESVKNPDIFYQNNVAGTQSILHAMHETDVKNIVFSSTAAVYGDIKENISIDESNKLNPINPYGETKLKAEQFIQKAPNIRSVCLRYFNACGASHESEIGEMHYPESHLIPLIIQAALGMRENIAIYGTDYQTKDGSCIRDYIHVEDLAKAHTYALEYLLDGGENLQCNLGTNYGYSVREIIETVKDISGIDFQVIEKERRVGDPATLIANNKRAKDILNWYPKNDLNQIISSALRWHQSDIYQKFWNNKS